MAKSNEQTLELNLSLFNTRENNQIGKYFNLENNIKTINRMGPYSNVALHVASCYGYNEVVQLFLTNSALKSLQNLSSQVVLYDESKMDELRKSFLEIFNLHDSEEEIPDDDYIEWSLSGNDSIKKAKEFRAQIDLYKTYDNQHHLITKLLIEIIDYYLKEYLVEQEHFSKENTQKIEDCFRKAIEEKSYLIYFIKAYTLTNNFHRVLNKHLALYMLDYFDTLSYSSSQKKYRLINCLVHIVTLLINHPDIQKYNYKGITYRGLLMTENDLKHYTIGNHILNRSFVSTSKDRSIARIFADSSQQNSSPQTPNHHSLAKISVLLKYTIKQNQTAIDIEHISTIQDEQEVLILPFSVFQIKDRIENNPEISSPILIEIDLEECEEDEQINYEVQNSKSLTSLRDRTVKNRKKIVISKCLCGSIGLFIISGLILAVFALTRRITFNKNTQKASKDTKWKQEGITIAGGHDKGNQLDQLDGPLSIFIDDDETIYIANWGNDRIVEWKCNATSGQIVAGETGRGNQMNQLNRPTDVVIDKENNSLIISDRGNRRVMRWSRENNTKDGETIMEDIDYFGLTMDKNGSLYISDYKNHEVTRWKRGDQNGTIVAGGHGKGNLLNQLDTPTYIFVNEDYSLYVSDTHNHRAMKWLKDAKQGIVVAGENGQGNSLTQLSYPYGVVVDQLGQIYVADAGNHRVMRWCKEAKEGTIVVGGNGRGRQSNQFNDLRGLSFDRQGNLYVADTWNHRIQKFEID